MSIISKAISFIRENRFSFRMSSSKVRCDATGTLSFGKCVKIVNSYVYVASGSSLTIEDHVTLEHVYLTVKGSMHIGSYTQLSGTEYPQQSIYEVDNADVTIGHHSLIRCRRLWARFGAKMQIGDYTNINHDSEIRADESVKVGSYCMISYRVNIWDTNTHCIYAPGVRIARTMNYWPSFGKELERPTTKSVVVGNNVWIGEQANIMKGTNVGDNAIIGFGATLFGKTIESGATVVPKVELRIM